MAGAGGRNFGADFPQQSPRGPDDVELKKIIDKLANFVARNGPEFEQMTMNKQRENPKFQFLFGGEWHAYYKWRVATETQQNQGGFQPPPAAVGGGGVSQIPPLILPLMSVGAYPQIPPNMPPPFHPAPLFRGGPPPHGFPPAFPPNIPPPPLLPPSTLAPPSSSQNQPRPLSLMASNPTWQQQHQAPPPTNQAPPTGPTHQLQLVCQELQKEIEMYGVTDPMEVEFGSVVKRLMESCTKDSIASGKGWIFAHTHQPDDCAKVAKFLLRKTLDGPGVGYNEKLHIIYLINDVIHQCARKGAQDLLQVKHRVSYPPTQRITHSVLFQYVLCYYISRVLCIISMHAYTGGR
jgi:calcium homeostasis ER protein